MGNLNGKFDASTVAAYTRVDLIKSRSYESKKTATEVLTNRSAKALSFVKSGFDKKFGSKRGADADAVFNELPSQDIPSTPAPNRFSTRLQFTPCDD
eukprot:scaffold250265_cov68-Attheya_sp.AAC.1